MIQTGNFVQSNVQNFCVPLHGNNSKEIGSLAYGDASAKKYRQTHA